MSKAFPLKSLLLILSISSSFYSRAQEDLKDFAQYVDPMIGTAKMGVNSTISLSFEFRILYPFFSKKFVSL